MVDRPGDLGREAVLCLVDFLQGYVTFEDVYLSPGRHGDYFTLILCFAFMVIVGKLPRVPVFWSMLCSSFSPRGYCFLSIAGSWALLFSLFPHIGPEGLAMYTLSSTPYAPQLLLPQILARKVSRGFVVSPVDATLLGFSWAGLLYPQSWYLCAPDSSPFIN